MSSSDQGNSSDRSHQGGAGGLVFEPCCRLSAQLTRPTVPVIRAETTLGTRLTPSRQLLTASLRREADNAEPSANGSVPADLGRSGHENNAHVWNMFEPCCRKGTQQRRHTPTKSSGPQPSWVAVATGLTAVFCSLQGCTGLLA